MLDQIWSRILRHPHQDQLELLGFIAYLIEEKRQLTHHRLLILALKDLHWSEARFAITMQELVNQGFLTVGYQWHRSYGIIEVYQWGYVPKEFIES